VSSRDDRIEGTNRNGERERKFDRFFGVSICAAAPYPSGHFARPSVETPRKTKPNDRGVFPLIYFPATTVYAFISK